MNRRRSSSSPQAAGALSQSDRFEAREWRQRNKALHASGAVGDPENKFHCPIPLPLRARGRAGSLNLLPIQAA